MTPFAAVVAQLVRPRLLLGAALAASLASAWILIFWPGCGLVDIWIVVSWTCNGGGGGGW